MNRGGRLLGRAGSFVRRAAAAALTSLLLESGDFVLLESGDKILLES